MPSNQVNMTVNGEALSAELDPRPLLVHFLRENLKLTGTHVGCDTSQCGACTVHVNGTPIKSCTIFAGQLNGADIKTIEGVGAELHQLGLRTGVRYYWDTRTRTIQPYLGAGLLCQHAWARSSALELKADGSAFGFIAMVGVAALLGDALRLGLGCQLPLGLEQEIGVYTFDFDSVTPLVRCWLSTSSLLPLNFS